MAVSSDGGSTTETGAERLRIRKETDEEQIGRCTISKNERQGIWMVKTEKCEIGIRVGEPYAVMYPNRAVLHTVVGPNLMPERLVSTELSNVMYLNSATNSSAYF